jgi:hypothetical protein
MCKGCNNTCGGSGQAQSDNAGPYNYRNPYVGEEQYDDSGSGLKFTKPVGSANPIIAAGGGPAFGAQMLPEAMVTVTPQMLGYQDMWIGRDGDGNPASVVYPGSYGQLYQANRKGA